MEGGDGREAGLGGLRGGSAAGILCIASPSARMRASGGRSQRDATYH